MKHARKNKSSAKVIVWCILIVLFLLILLVGVWFFLKYGEKLETEPQTQKPGTEQTTPDVSIPSKELEPVQPESTAPPEPDTEESSEESTEPVVTPPVSEIDPMIELETPYVPLYFPEMWEDVLHIRTEEFNGYTMAFSVQFEEDAVYPVFDISFGHSNGTLLGTVTGIDGTNIEVFIRFYEPDETLIGDWLETYLAMQEDANELIDRLPLGEELQPEESKDILIQTPFCQLAYPGRWADYLVVEQNGGTDYVVDFYAQLNESEKIHLFAVVFRFNADDPVMVLRYEEESEVGVCVELTEIDETTLPQDQLDTVYSMQDEINTLLDKLSEGVES